MLSVLLAVPKTPLYQRLEAAGRLHNGDDLSRYVGTSGGTNFEPLNMTAEELRLGQERLYRRLYAPEAFAARLVGNMDRFHDVTYRPEPIRTPDIATVLPRYSSLLAQGQSGSPVLLQHRGPDACAARREAWAM